MAERLLVAAAVAAVVAIDFGYLAIIRSQGGGGPTADVLTVPFVFGYLGLMGVLLVASLVVPSGSRAALRAAASVGLLAMAVLAAFSIGVAIAIPALLAVASLVLALIARPQAWPSTVVAGVLAVAVLAVGFQLSWNYLVCPPTGQMGGSTAGFFGSISYECNDGVLTKH